MSPPAAPGRLTGADGLRGLAAVGVVVLHVWMATGANAPDPPGWFDEAVGELRLGLMFFFVLSAHLLAGPFIRAGLEGRPRPSLRRYARNRALRIWPGYLVALLGAFWILRGTGHGREGGWDVVAAAAVFVQDQLPWAAGRIDPPMWSLGVEVCFYLALVGLGPLLVAVGRRHGRRGLVAVATALVLVGLGWTLAGVTRAWPATTMTSLPTFLPAFACGIASAALTQGRAPGRTASRRLLAGGIALVLLDAAWHVPGTGTLGHVVLDLPAAAGFALVLGGLIGRPPGLLDARPMHALGTISFGLYLWHLPVLYWLEVHHRAPRGFVAALTLVLVVAGALATASWHLVERPALRLGARRRTARATVPTRDPAFA